MGFSVVQTSLLYISDTTESVDLMDLLRIQEQAIQNNARENITGILFHCDGHFIQLLEGENDAVLQLFVKIVQDDRHRNVRLLYHRRTDHRNFSDWHMAMLDLELHSEAQRLHVKDLIFYAEHLRTDPAALQNIDTILSRFNNLLVTVDGDD